MLIINLTPSLVFGLGALGGVEGTLDGGKEEGHEDPEDGDDDQEFDQGEGAGGFHGWSNWEKVVRLGSSSKHFLATADGNREIEPCHAKSHRRGNPGARET